MSDRSSDVGSSALADFEGRRQRRASLAEFVDRVSARLGRNVLQGFELRESHIPERASVFLPAADGMAISRKDGADFGFFGCSRPLSLCRYTETVASGTGEVPGGPPFREPES